MLYLHPTLPQLHRIPFSPCHQPLQLAEPGIDIRTWLHRLSSKNVA